MDRRGKESDDFLFRYPLPSSSFSAGGGGAGAGPDHHDANANASKGGPRPLQIHGLRLQFGKVACVTVLKTAPPAGAAASPSASSSSSMTPTPLFAPWTVSNGRAPEFIRRRVYEDKSRCYECGEEGHLSYECPRNQLGPRERPNPKRARRGAQRRGGDGDGGENWGFDGGDEAVFDDDKWASVVDTRGAEEKARGREEWTDDGKDRKKKKEKKVSYFSDESGEGE